MHAARAPRRLLCSASILLLAALGGGCWRDDACSTLRPRFEAAQLAQRRGLEEGAAPAPDAPLAAAVAVPRGVVQRLVDEHFKQAPREIKPLHTTVLGLRLSAGGAWSRLEVLGAGRCADCLRLRLGGSLQAEAKQARLTLFGERVPVEATLEAPLRLVADTGGAARLVVELRQIEGLQIKLRPSGLPGELLEPLNGLASRAASSLLQTLGSEQTLFTWDPLPLEGTRLRLHPAALQLSPDGETLRVGWRLNAPLEGAGVDLDALKPQGEEVLAALHPGALTWLSRAALLAGAIPSRLNTDLQPDPQGELRVAVEDVIPRQDGTLDTRFAVWRLSEDGCFEAHLQSTAQVQLQAPLIKTADGRGATLALQIKDVSLLRSEGDDWGLKLALWWNADALTRTLDLYKEAIDPQHLRVGDAGAITLAPRGVTLRPEAVEIRMGLVSRNAR